MAALTLTRGPPEVRTGLQPPGVTGMVLLTAHYDSLIRVVMLSLTALARSPSI